MLFAGGYLPRAIFPLRRLGQGDLEKIDWQQNWEGAGSSSISATAQATVALRVSPRNGWKGSYRPIADVERRPGSCHCVEMTVDSNPCLLDEDAAFRAMQAYLTAYWERGLRSSNDIATLLSNLQCDPATAADWRTAVEQTLS
jgi:hypothetical protein